MRSMADNDTGYSAIVNVLDFTAVSFPAGYADKHLDLVPSSFAPMSKEDEAVNSSCTSQTPKLPPRTDTPRPDESSTFHGAPVGLQLMCRRTEEEKALKLVELILEAQAQTSVSSW